MDRWLASILALVLTITPIFAGEQPSPAPQPPPAAQTAAPAPQTAPASQPIQPMAPLPVSRSLKVVPLAGNGEVNDLERRIMAPLVVQVLDRNDRPAEGAEVVFRFPLNGPGAVFPGGKNSQTVRTNGTGQAAALNWVANNEVGTFEVHISATYGNQIGETTIKMSNATRVADEDIRKARKHGSWWSPTWVKLAVIGGGAAAVAGIILATRGGGGATPAPASPTITITPGTPSVGGPR
jgi:hypothetical protein